MNTVYFHILNELLPTSIPLDVSHNHLAYYYTYLDCSAARIFFLQNVEYYLRIVYCDVFKQGG